MTNEEIHKIALAHGFRDRPQGDGTIGLNAYVYEFARAMFEAGRSAVPAGWKLVPIEPTQEMTAAMEHQWLYGSQIDVAKREYKAALDAAPEAKP